MRLLYPAGVQVELRIVLQKSVGLFFYPRDPLGRQRSFPWSLLLSQGIVTWCLGICVELFCLVKSIDLELVVWYTNTIK